MLARLRDALAPEVKTVLWDTWLSARRQVPGLNRGVAVVRFGRNFGDNLNANLLDHFGVKYHLETASHATFFPIGSILERLVSTAPAPGSHLPPAKIWGSGFIGPAASTREHFIKPVEILALRGEISRKRCEKILERDLGSVPLGDPGLLTSQIFTDLSFEKQYDVGIIPHYADAGAPALRNVELEAKSFTLIDVYESVEQVVRRMARCRCILSSAMHGLIVADSLGLPNRRIILSDNILGGSYKFRDYYSAFPMDMPEPLDLRSAIVSDRDVEIVCERYSITRASVQRIGDSLRGCFAIS